MQAEVGDAQLVSNSLAPFLTLASSTSLGQPLSSAPVSPAAGRDAASQAAALAAAEADAAWLAAGDEQDAAATYAGTSILICYVYRI